MNTYKPAFLAIFFIFISGMLASCATLTSDIKVETHDYPGINYQQYHTYAWLGGAKIVFDPIGQWEQPTLDTDEEVRFIINRELRARGMSPVEQNPDLFVAYAAGVDMTALELKEDPKTREQRLTNVPKAALVVALVDARTGYIVWLGYATGNVHEQQSMENIRKRIDYAIKQIFKPFKSGFSSNDSRE